MSKMRVNCGNKLLMSDMFYDIYLNLSGKLVQFSNINWIVQMFSKLLLNLICYNSIIGFFFIKIVFPNSNNSNLHNLYAFWKG